MSRNSRSMVERTVIKVVFRLQFHATHIPQTAWNNLFISFIPSGYRKATAQTNKANVRNGICKWVDPIYETTMLMQDSLTKQYDEKLYKLIVAMGTSRSSLLGAANINLSNYVDASTPTIVALPLRGSNSGAILHVAVQLLNTEAGLRELEQHREVADLGFLANNDHDLRLPRLGRALGSCASVTKVNPRVRKSEPKEFPSLDTASGSDEFCNTSGSLYAEKHNNSETREIVRKKSLISGDLSELSLSQSSTIVKGKYDHHSLKHVTNEWVPESSKDNEMVVLDEENNRPHRELEAANLSIDEMQGEICKLLGELDESKAEKEILISQMDQMKSYYEEKQKEILAELQNLRHEHSSCVNPISSPKAEIMELSKDKCSLDIVNKELEGRTAISEEKLRRTRKNYSISVNRLQKDLDALSLQAHTMFETNKTLIGAALEEASQPFLLGSTVDQRMEPQDRDVVLNNNYVGSDRLLFDRKIQEDFSEIHLANINLDLLSVMLRQSLLESALDSRTEINELVEQLELSCKSNQSLRLDLQNLSNQICNVNEEKATFAARCTDLALDSQTLEVKLRIVIDEKCALSEKIGELESLVDEYRNYKSKYEICSAEKAKMGSDVSLLQEEVMTMKNKVSENKMLQKKVYCIQENLEKLITGNKQVNGPLPGNKEGKNTGSEKFASISIRLEDSLRICNDKILKLVEQKEILVNERDTALVNCASIEAEFKFLKQEFEHEALDMLSKLNSFSALVEKLQTEFEVVSNKLHDSSEAEEKLTQITMSLLSYFTKLEAALQDLTLENTDLVDKIKTFESVVDELEDNKLSSDELKQENLSQTGLSQSNVNEFDILTKELNNNRGNVESLKDELSILRGIRDKLDAQILDLNNQLSDVESEKVSLQCQLSHADVQVKKAPEVSSQNSEYQLEMHELLIVADVVQTVLVKQYEIHVEKLYSELEYFHKNPEEADESNIVLCSRPNSCVASEHYAVENAFLLPELQSLKPSLEYNVGLNKDLEQSNSIIATNLDKTRQLLEDSTCLVASQQEMYSKMQEELSEMRLANLTLDVFSVILHRTLAEVSMDSRTEVHELVDQLDISCRNNQSMRLKLQNLSHEICTLKQEKANIVSRSEDLALENQTLEAKLRSFNDEKCALSERIKHLESLVAEYRNYKSNFETCDTEKGRLEHVPTTGHHISNGSSSLQEEVMTLKIKVNENEKLQKMVNYIQEKLNDLLVFGDEQVNDFLPHYNEENVTGCEKLSSNTMQLEEGLIKFNDNILQLKCLLRSSQTEIEDLILSKEELEIKFLLLQTTFEEYKNLLNDMEKCKNREVKGSLFVPQESLRIAFVKEEYETKLQDVHHQLSISEKHGEEIILKLQDALDDLERRKKCEATLLKRNEEYVLKIQDLEGELELARSEIRNSFTAYEQIKAKLDCSVTSLDCCKEEKSQLMVSLQECNDYNCKLGDEMEMLREQVESFKASFLINAQDKSSEVGKLLENSLLSSSGWKGEALKNGALTNFSDDQGAQDTLVMVTKSTEDLSNLRNSDSGFNHNGGLIKDQLEPQFLSSIIEHLQKELEEMKSENTLPDELLGEISPRDQVYLEKVTEEQNMSSLTGSSLQGKNSSIQSQSSSLKLHSKEAAISQSLIDSNLLIKDMLEMKERYDTMETELKEMHDRYSQLSLNFAEVEGERQKLTFMLKNVRPSKQLLSRSSTFIHRELS